MTETDNKKLLEHAQLLEDTHQMFANTKRLNELTIRAVALQAGARALRAEATKEQEQA